MNSPINADGTEIEDAGCTHHHIQSDKDVTVDLAEAPLSHYLEEKNNKEAAAYTDSQQNKATLQHKETLIVKSAFFYYSNFLFIFFARENQEVRRNKE